MEPAVEEVWSSGRDGSNLLGLPGPCPWDDDDEPLGLGGIKPKSSPIPRRRSSDFSCSGEELQPPPSSSRRVSFADAFGLSLVSVKKFDSWTVCDPSDPLEGDLNEAKEYFLSQLFTPPPTPQELTKKVQENKLELESLELLPGTTTLKGIIRVLNLCFDKLVYIRTSLDCWSSHFDLLAEYIPGSSNGDTDCFSFRLTLVPPFGEQGARVDFCLRYETPFGTFWANNSGQNYVLFCHEKTKEQDQSKKKHKKKSCLRSTSHDCSSETSSTSSTEEIPEITLNCGMAALTEPVKEEKTQDECSKLQEENISKSRRSRRKAARLAKVKQYFAEREKKGIQQFEKETSGTPVKANVENHISEDVETPSKLCVDVWAKMQERVSLSPAEKIKTLKCTSISVDTESQQVNSANTETQDEKNIPARCCELTTSISQPVLSPVDPVNSNKSAVSSVSQALDNSQNKETLIRQTDSIVQQLLKCQTPETSVNKSVEKAWECFEKGAVERMGSIMDIRIGEDTTSTEDEIKENKPDIQPSGHNFTFETIVAPLYHQVFEKMEAERRDFRNTQFSARRSVGKREDKCLRTITNQCYPRTPSTETRPNSCKSKKHDVNDVYCGTCREMCPPDVFNTKNTNNEPSSDTNVNRELAEMEATFHAISVTDKMVNPLHINIPELNMTTDKQQLSNNLPFQMKYLTPSGQGSLQKEQQNQDGMNLKSECCFLNSSLEDPSQNTPPENSQQDDISVDYMVLTKHSDLYSTDVKTSSTDSSATHISFETGLSTELTKIQGKEAKTLQCQLTPMESNFNEILPGSKCLEESHSLIPDSSLFYNYITSNITPNLNQSEAPELSLNLSSLTPIQRPDFTSFLESQIASDIILLNSSIDGTHQIQGIENMCEIVDGNSHYVGEDTKTSSDRNKESNGSERTYINQQDRTLDRTSLHPPHTNKELSSVSKGVSQEKEADVFEKHNVNINEKRESTDKAEYQSVQVSEKTKERDELVEVEKLLQQQEILDKPKQQENKEQKTEESEHEQQVELKAEEKQILEQKKEGTEEQKREEKKEQTRKEEYEEQNLEEQDKKVKQEEQDEEELEEGEEELECYQQKVYEEQNLEKPEEKGKQEEQYEEEELEGEEDLERYQQKVYEEPNIEKQVEKGKQEEQYEEEQLEEGGEDLELYQQKIYEEQNLEKQEERGNQEEQNEELEGDKDLELYQQKVYKEHNLEKQEEKGKQEQPGEEEKLEEGEKELELYQQEVYDEQNLEKQEERGNQEEQDEEELEEGEKDLELYQHKVYKEQNLEKRQEEKGKQEEKYEEVEKAEEKQEKEQDDDDEDSENELLYIDDDDEEEAEKEKSKDSEQYLEECESEDHHSLEVEVEEQDSGSRVSTVTTLKTPITVDSKKIHLQVKQELQTEEHSTIGKKEIQWGTDFLQHVLPGNPDTTFSERGMLINKEEVGFQTKERQIANLEGINDQSENNVGNETSTESLSDDEMDLYLHQLKSSQKPGLKDAVSSGNYCRRSSVTRTRTMHSRMPSISESVDEDQPNASLNDLTNEEMTELEKATLPLVEDEEEILQRNVLWWREFFSSDNMSKMIGCTFLLVVFLVTAYYYDFVACFGLYLLALYWLYFRGESKSHNLLDKNISSPVSIH